MRQSCSIQRLSRSARVARIRRLALSNSASSQSFCACRFARMSDPSAYEHCRTPHAPICTYSCGRFRSCCSWHICAPQSSCPGRPQPHSWHVLGPSAEGHGRLHLEHRRGFAAATAASAIAIAPLTCSSRRSRFIASRAEGSATFARALMPPAATMAALWLATVVSGERT